MAQELIKDLQAGDLLLLDRGYPCYKLFFDMVQQGVDFVVRLPQNGMFKAVKTFLASGKRDGKITLYPPKALFKKHPDGNFAPLKLRIIKVSIPGSPKAPHPHHTHYWIGKNSRPPNSEIFTISDGIKRSFSKPLKSTSMPNNSTAAASNSSIKNSSLFIYTTPLTRIMMMETADLYEIPLESVETKAALLAVSRYLDRLWIADTVDDCEKLLNLCLNEISWRLYKKTTWKKISTKI